MRVGPYDHKQRCKIDKDRVRDDVTSGVPILRQIVSTASGHISFGNVP